LTSVLVREEIAEAGIRLLRERGFESVAALHAAGA
jgi:hypothetical protein